jgi:hypothetical protein
VEFHNFSVLTKLMGVKSGFLRFLPSFSPVNLFLHATPVPLFHHFRCQSTVKKHDLKTFSNIFQKSVDKRCSLWYHIPTNRKGDSNVQESSRQVMNPFPEKRHLLVPPVVRVFCRKRGYEQYGRAQGSSLSSCSEVIKGTGAQLFVSGAETPASASFSARLIRLISASRRRAADQLSAASVYTSRTGRRERVYFAPLPALCTFMRRTGSTAAPV